MKRLFLLPVPFFAAAGCATGLAGGKILPKVERDEFSTVYLARKAGFIGSGQATTIEFNGEKLLYLNQGHCVTFKIPAGKNKLSAVIYGGWLPVPGPNRRLIEFESQKGESYFFTTDVHMGISTIDFDRVSVQRWLEIAQPCVLNDLNAQKEVNKPIAEGTDPPIIQKGIYDTGQVDKEAEKKFGPGSLEIQSKVQGARVFIDGQSMGEVPLRVSNLTPGPHEVQVVREDFEWKQRIQVESNQKKVIEANLKRPGLDENYLMDRVFYFENCAFSWDKFNYLIRFQKQGRLEGAEGSGSFAGISKDSLDLRRLDGRWFWDQDKIIIEFKMLRGFRPRRVMKVEVDIGPDRKDLFPTRCESSTEYRSAGGGMFIGEGKRDIVNCQMRELR
jgi:hypothetical protein